MQKLCIDCGELFTAVKPFYTVCFDCHLARLKQARADRAALFIPRVQVTSKPRTTKAFSGDKADAMPGTN